MLQPFKQSMLIIWSKSFYIKLCCEIRGYIITIMLWYCLIQHYVKHACETIHWQSVMSESIIAKSTGSCQLWSEPHSKWSQWKPNGLFRCVWPKLEPVTLWQWIIYFTTSKRQKQGSGWCSGWFTRLSPLWTRFYSTQLWKWV